MTFTPGLLGYGVVLIAAGLAGAPFAWRIFGPMAKRFLGPVPRTKLGRRVEDRTGTCCLPHPSAPMTYGRCW
ncbi:hypothetical protein ACFTY8_23820 [Streptomyces mirabilis]|uniref:hypothetical protein n=1 Tax=Streptomyces mirabilis TaxID=68239 RepID=UPI00363D1FCA